MRCKVLVVILAITRLLPIETLVASIRAIIRCSTIQSDIRVEV